MARPRIHLDEMDHQILSLLTQDAGLKNKELARRVGLAPSTCLARVKRLELHGFIVGYRAIVARSGRGARLEGWADIRFDHLTPEATRKFADLVATAPEIIEAHRIAGRSDYVVRFCAGDMGAWTVFRDAIEALGCKAEAQFSVLVEPLK